MTYRIDFKEAAQADLVALAKSEPKAFLKAQALIEELKIHPRTGTGKPEPLKGDKHGRWSRRITDKHRLVYEVNGKEILVLVISAYGHYDDK